MDAFLISFREATEYSAILLLLAGVWSENKKALITAAFVAVASGFLIAFFNYPLSGSAEKFYINLAAYSFLAILILSLVSGISAVWPVISLVLAVIIPSAELALFIIGEASLKGGLVYFYSLAGMSAAVVLLLFLFRLVPKLNLQRFFSTKEAIVVVAAFSLLFGGSARFDKTLVMVTMYRGLHGLIVSTVDAFRSYASVIPQSIFTYISSERFGLAVTALILFIPPVYLFIRLLVTPEPSTEGIEIKAGRRKVLAVYTDTLIRRGTPLLMALLVIIVLLHSANLAMSPSFDPEPIPLADDGGMITLPLQGKFGDMSDGRIRKFSVSRDGKAFRFMVIVRPGGDIVAALDACEICPDYGYVQRGEHLICKYCGTPIPLQSLGLAGGCNPIPLKFQLDGASIAINRDEIIAAHDKWIGHGTEHAH
ncbi:MAG: DUF2318 domain-containing protein [Nitrospirae bacterium]|nr:DUF2318 domain-containing protein [Nitrospirota bacterium]